MRRSLWIFVFVAAFCLRGAAAEKAGIDAKYSEVGPAAKVSKPAAPSAEEVVVKVRETLLSDYVFRGQKRNDDPIAVSEVEVEKGIFGLRLMANSDLTDQNEHEFEFTEFRLDLGFKKQVYDNPANGLFSAASLFGGLIYYGFPEIDRDATTELYVGVDAATAFDVHAKATLFYDVDEADGLYLDYTLYREFAVPAKLNPFGDKLPIKAVPEIGLGWGSPSYNDFYFAEDDSALTDWHAGLALKATKGNLEFGPFVKYTDILDGSLQDADDDSSNWIYGFTFGYKF